MSANELFYDFVSTPIGRIFLLQGASGLEYVGLPNARKPLSMDASWRQDAHRLQYVKEQFEAWFAGDIQVFDMPLKPRGTAFQLQVWQGLRDIPYAQTWSYGELARHIGKPKAVRAVGAANGANPLSIVVPCHRVIGADGSLTGYGGGMAAKQWLLRHEKEHAGLLA